MTLSLGVVMQGCTCSHIGDISKMPEKSYTLPLGLGQTNLVMKNREFNHLHNMCIKFEKECVYVCVCGGGLARRHAGCGRGF